MVSGRGGDLIGLDLGATAVRAALLTGDRRAVQDSTAGSVVGGIAAGRLGSVALPPGAIVRGVVQNPDAVTAALRQLVAQTRLKGRRVVLGISTPQVVVRKLTLPMMPRERLRLALPFQARDVLPIPVDDAVLDFSPIGAPDGSAMVTGLLTAAPRWPVLAAVRAVEKAGLTVARVDLSSFGLLRSVGTAGRAVEALVDVGSDLTTIVIHVDGIPRVVRVIAFGGHQLTERLMDALSIPYAEAEALKCSVGTAGDSVAARHVGAGLSPLLAEVRGSLNFFAAGGAAGGAGSLVAAGVDGAGGNAGAVTQVLLTGGSAALPGLDALLRWELDVPVRRVTPLRHLSVGGEPDGRGGPPGAATAVSVGLALGVAA